jgi:hypothetical protein
MQWDRNPAAPIAYSIGNSIHLSQPIMKVDLNLMREAIGTVVSDGSHEYVVVDYSLANHTVELWCKMRQAFYKVTPHTFDDMCCISG